MFKSYSAGNDVVGGIVEVDWNDRIVGFGVCNVVLVIDEAAVFAHFELVAVPIGTHAVAVMYLALTQNALLMVLLLLKVAGE